MPSRLALHRILNLILSLVVFVTSVASHIAIASPVIGAATRVASPPVQAMIELEEVGPQTANDLAIASKLSIERAPAEFKSVLTQNDLYRSMCSEPSIVQYTPPKKVNSKTVYYRYLRTPGKKAFDCRGVGAGPVARKLAQTTEAGTCVGCRAETVTAPVPTKSFSEIWAAAVNSGSGYREKICPANPAPVSLFAGLNCMENMKKGLFRSLVDMVKGIGYLANKAFWGVVGFFKKGAVQQTDHAMSAVMRFLMNLPKANLLKAMTNTGEWLKKLAGAFVQNLLKTARDTANCQRWENPRLPLISECKVSGPGWNCMNWDQKSQMVCSLVGGLGSDIALMFIGGIGFAKVAARSGKLMSALENIGKVSKNAVTMASNAASKGGAVGRAAKAIVVSTARGAAQDIVLTAKVVGRALIAIDKIPGLKQYNRLTEKAFLAGFEVGGSGLARAGRAARTVEMAEDASRTARAANDNNVAIEAANDNGVVETAMAAGETPVRRAGTNAIATDSISSTGPTASGRASNDFVGSTTSPTASTGGRNSGSGFSAGSGTSRGTGESSISATTGGQSGTLTDRRSSPSNAPPPVAATTNESDLIGYSAADAPPVSPIRTPRPNNRPLQTIREAKTEIRRRPGYSVRKINSKKFVADNRARNIIPPAENRLFRERMVNPTVGGRTAVIRDFSKKANNTKYGLDRSTAITTTLVERAAKRYENLAKKYPDDVELVRFEGPNRLEVRFDPKPGRRLPAGFEDELADVYKSSVVEHTDYLHHNQLVRATDEPMDMFKYGVGPDSHTANLTARSNREFENSLATHRWEDGVTQKHLETVFNHAKQLHTSVKKKYDGTDLFLKDGRIDPTIADIIAKSDSSDAIVDNLKEYNIFSRDSNGRALSRQDQIVRARELDEYVESARNFGIEYYGERTPLNLKLDDTVCFGFDLCGQNGRNLSHNTAIFDGSFEDVIAASVKAEKDSTDEFNLLMNTTIDKRTKYLEDEGYTVETMRSGDDGQQTIRNRDGSPVKEVRPEQVDGLASCTDGIVCLRDSKVAAQVETTIKGKKAVRDKQTLIDTAHDLEKEFKKTLPKRFKEHNFHVAIDQDGVMTLHMSHPPAMTSKQTLEYERDLLDARSKFTKKVETVSEEKRMGLTTREPASNADDLSINIESIDLAPNQKMILTADEVAQNTMVAKFASHWETMKSKFLSGKTKVQIHRLLKKHMKGNLHSHDPVIRANSAAVAEKLAAQVQIRLSQLGIKSHTEPWRMNPSYIRDAIQVYDNGLKKAKGLLKNPDITSDLHPTIREKIVEFEQKKKAFQFDLEEATNGTGPRLRIVLDDTDSLFINGIREKQGVEQIDIDLSSKQGGGFASYHDDYRSISLPIELVLKDDRNLLNDILLHEISHASIANKRHLGIRTPYFLKAETIIGKKALTMPGYERSFSADEVQAYRKQIAQIMQARQKQTVYLRDGKIKVDLLTQILNASEKLTGSLKATTRLSREARALLRSPLRRNEILITRKEFGAEVRLPMYREKELSGFIYIHVTDITAKDSINEAIEKTELYLNEIDKMVQSHADDSA